MADQTILSHHELDDVLALVHDGSGQLPERGGRDPAYPAQPVNRHLPMIMAWQRRLPTPGPWSLTGRRFPRAMSLRGPAPASGPRHGPMEAACGHRPAGQGAIVAGGDQQAINVLTGTKGEGQISHS
jgi:hypothetical protein